MRRVALLTGGGDKPYAIGLAASLSARHVELDFVGSDDLDVPEITGLAGVRFLNLRGNQSSDASALTKLTRVLRYYLRLLRYAIGSDCSVFHILWNNKFELFDRTALVLFYRLLGKRIALTIHNVNAADRDGGDGPVNRLTLRIQYALSHHLFVHTEEMRRQLQAEFGVPAHKVTTIRFGINNTVPITAMTRADARRTFGLSPQVKVLLFFGYIAPYKGLAYAVEAMARLKGKYPDAQLIIGGRPKSDDGYWPGIAQAIERLGLQRNVIHVTSFIPDADVEKFFKAADVLVLPYTHVFQSGVLFTGYHFGLPAIATNVGGLKDDVVDGVTGFTCRASDVESLVETFDKFFQSSLYVDLESRQPEIREMMSDRNSWSRVADETCRVYNLLWTNGLGTKLTGSAQSAPTESTQRGLDVRN